MPDARRGSYVRRLLELDRPSALAETEPAWDAEIKARIQVVDEGRAASLPFEALRRETDQRGRQ